MGGDRQRLQEEEEDGEGKMVGAGTASVKKFSFFQYFQQKCRCEKNHLSEFKKRHSDAASFQLNLPMTFPSVKIY